MKRLRDAEIFRRIRQPRVVTVHVLAKDRQVSASTIRRDSQRLGREGDPIRAHGGTASLHPGRIDVDLPFPEVAMVNRDEKDAIAGRRQSGQRR